MDTVFASMLDLKTGWDGYNAEPPTPSSIATAQGIIEVLNKGGINPNRIRPSVVGGVGITTRHKESEVYIEVMNTQETYVVYSHKDNEPIVHPVKLDELVGEIKNFQGLY